MTEGTKAPMTWWRIDKHTLTITPVSVGKETEHSDRRNHRCSKLTTYEAYYRTYTEARTTLIERESDKVDRLSQQLANARTSYAAVLRLDESPPETPDV